MEPNGLFRIGVPDTRWPLLDYAGVGDGRWLLANETERWHAEWCKTPLDHINYHFRQGTEHRYAYDFETIANALRQAGFEQINQSEFDPAFDGRELGTLYVNARKPQAAL